ncbi:hypothetical protein CCAX7_55760 [Capsulimonas corticalis]|uniref:Uncharacterized protein n=1 Tax=Capsulimonas corticalis TaxID=2219043 RepID=A0A402D0W4_9BACT|nr:GGDEF domain-containing protein [Capsulimonas corticalis]BDI33525.1 hypothetical protein CCAX7_55760 [Capsulimonas corticalis]
MEVKNTKVNDGLRAEPENGDFSVPLWLTSGHGALRSLVDPDVFQERMDKECAKSERERTPLSLALIGVEDFPMVRRANREAQGDEVMRVIASAIAACGSSEAIVARYGDQEFAVVTPGDLKDIRAILSQIRASLAYVKYRRAGYPENIPHMLAVGLSIFPYDAANREELFTLADRRLHASRIYESTRLH